MDNLDWKFIDTSTTSAASDYKPSIYGKRYKGTGDAYLREEALRRAVSEKDMEKIKATVKEYLTTQLKTEIRQQIRAISADLAQLKREKEVFGAELKDLKKHIKDLKNQFLLEKIEIQDEIKDMTRVLKRKADAIIRFQNMDLG